jgi:hypothetical protein
MINKPLAAVSPRYIFTWMTNPRIVSSQFSSSLHSRDHIASTIESCCVPESHGILLVRARSLSALVSSNGQRKVAFPREPIPQLRYSIAHIDHEFVKIRVPVAEFLPVTKAGVLFFSVGGFHVHVSRVDWRMFSSVFDVSNEHVARLVAAGEQYVHILVIRHHVYVCVCAHMRVARWHNK